MHVDPIQALRVTKAKATTSTAAVAQEDKRSPSFISDLAYNRDGTIAITSKEYPISCFCHHGPQANQTRDSLPTSDRSVSSASTISSHRSVSSMKQLLPLKLQPPLPQSKADLLSWIDNTIPLDPYFKNRSEEELSTYSSGPFDSYAQDVRPSRGPFGDHDKGLFIYPRTYEELVPEEKSARMKSNMYSWIECGLPKASFVTASDEVDEERNLFQEFLDSESSRSNFSLNGDEVFDALATRLAPARAQVVELNRAPQLPDFAELSKPSIANRPGTPYSFSRKRGSIGKLRLFTQDTAPWKLSIEGQEKHRQMSASISLDHDPPWEQVRYDPHSPYVADSSFGCAVQEFPERLCNDARAEIVATSTSNIDAIDVIIQDFPHQMLFLDTACIVDIRHQNYLLRFANSQQKFSDISNSSSIYSLQPDRPQPSLRQRCSPSNIWGHFIRAVKIKSSLYRKKMPLSYINRPSSSISAGWRSLASHSDVPLPELSILWHIFPNTQDWWLHTLYAQLVAYNHLQENHLRPTLIPPSFPSKAFETLGISNGLSDGSISTSSTDARLANLKEKLVSCITWTIDRIMGNSHSPKDMKMRSECERDYALVKALAEIVKISETCG